MITSILVTIKRFGQIRYGIPESKKNNVFKKQIYSIKYCFKNGSKKLMFRRHLNISFLDQDHF